MDISWSCVLACIFAETHFAFLIGASSCSLTLWGLTVALFLSLLLCNLTALERNLNLWCANIITRLHPCFNSQVVPVHGNVLPSCYLPHKDAKQLRASFLCIATVFRGKIKLCTKHITPKCTTWCSLICTSSNQEICGNFLLEDIDLQLYKEWVQNFCCLSWCVHRLSPCYEQYVIFLTGSTTLWRF